MSSSKNERLVQLIEDKCVREFVLALLDQQITDKDKRIMDI